MGVCVQVSINKGYNAVLKDLNPKGLAVGETNIINYLTKKVLNRMWKYLSFINLVFIKITTRFLQYY